MYLFWDVETTGLPSKDFKPRIVQLAAILTTEDNRRVAFMNAIIKPDGWEVPEEAANIHGKTTDICHQHGIPMIDALTIFNSLKSVAKMRIAHNLQFDKQMMAIEAEFCGVPHDSSGIESFCTMNASRDIVKYPPTEKMLARGMTGFKSPSMQEAYRFFNGVNFDNAHDAMADVKACRDVFFKLKGLPKE